MIYQSTRDPALTASAAEAILRGPAPDGGLYVPSSLPDLRPALPKLLTLDFQGMAAAILQALLPDFTTDEMTALVRSAYTGRFETADVTPTVPVGDDYILELFRGPTSAFKDVALSILPYLMTASQQKCGVTDPVLILTATSGDTGKAAMAGFRDVPGTRIIVFYPHGGVSEVQQAQMTTQEGGNVCVCAVRGNFDDAQTAVKEIFASDLPLRLSSANSINIGRLAPQVVYYFKAYADLLRLGRVKLGDPVDFAVPTGNFGDILAGYLAKRMGLPVGTLICASNRNDVLADFLRTGVYDKNRPFYKTVSPSMDILVSSNLERLLYLMSGDAALTAALMAQLRTEGRYEVPADLLARLQADFFPGRCDDEQTKAAIGDVWRAHHYLCDTHTAVAWRAAQAYKAARPGAAPVVVLSTASPYKFPAAVLEGLGGSSSGDGFDLIDRLHALTQVPVPENLRGLRDKTVLHRDVTDIADMPAYVLKKAGEKEWNA